MEFRVVFNSDCYTLDESTGLYTDMRDTQAGLKYLYDNGTALKVSGIIRPGEDAVSTMLSSTIGYTHKLTEYVIENSKDAASVQAQLDAMVEQAMADQTRETMEQTMLQAITAQTGMSSDDMTDQERTKEIGVLRAIGASKKNVSNLFNAETIIIGFASGGLGVLITKLLCYPINAVLHHFTGISSLNAYLPWQMALILIAISVVLTMFAGLIPSRSAAKKDPVVALRSE